MILLVKVWVNRQNIDVVNDEFENAFIYNILDKNKDSNIKTDVNKLWNKYNKASLDPIYEDLLIISLIVMALDKHIPRAYFEDRWTRNMRISIPVKEIDKWEENKHILEDMLSFLSGDEWSFSFRNTTKEFRKHSVEYENPDNILKNKSFDAVSLFSGGLDSFSGANKLISQGKNIIFVGFKEYNQLVPIQRNLYGEIKNYYNANNTDLLLFRVNPKRPINESEDIAKYDREITNRSRSFLFISLAIIVASMIDSELPVYVPENGFIGINIPLTSSRSGSCSTRTTHPNFVNLFNELLTRLGINNEITNIYKEKSKGEILEEFNDNELLNKLAKETISCSHPCQVRYLKEKIPQNCGSCYPCLIRRAAMFSAGIEDCNYKFDLDQRLINREGRGSDFRALLLSLKEYLIHKEDKNYLRNLLIKTGKLTIHELDIYEQIYVKTMEEIYYMLNASKNRDVIFDYLGVEY